MASDNQQFFAPWHVLQSVQVPQELVDMCGGPAAFLDMIDELRNTPMSELPSDVVDAISAEIERLKN